MTETAIFAGGCFWCMVKPFDQQPGIKSVISGYTGGTVANPTYEQVASHTTGHTEAVKITFDPDVISYADLVEIYWRQTDPTDASGQFQDRGDSYRPVILLIVKLNVELQLLQEMHLRLAVSLLSRLWQPLKMRSHFIPQKPSTKTFIDAIHSVIKSKKWVVVRRLLSNIGNKLDGD